MSLIELVQLNRKEIAGSRAKNRLTIQISYAIELIMDFFSADYIILMDYIEDISVICDPAESAKIHLYQIKTKAADKTYKLSTVISDKWFEKLYANALKYGEHVGSVSLVCNTDIEDSNNNYVFPNERTYLTDPVVQENIRRIKNAIARALGISPEEVDLSKYCFVRSRLSTAGHKGEIEHAFSNFLYAQSPNLQIATAKAIFKLIYDELDDRFNYELDENCSDINEIFVKKGLTSNNINEILKCGLDIQLPELERLFSDFNISSVAECRRIADSVSRLTRDMHSNLSIFIELKKVLYGIISNINQGGVDNMPDLYKAVYHSAIDSNDISPIFKDEYYIKLLIMNMIYKYSMGGEL